MHKSRVTADEILIHKSDIDNYWTNICVEATKILVTIQILVTPALPLAVLSKMFENYCLRRTNSFLSVAPVTSTPL